VDVVPAFYQTRVVEDLERWDLAFSNNLLRVGEVKRVIYPEDNNSRSKKFVEYDVYVQHRENNTAVTKMYPNCWMMNSLSGLADYEFRMLRVDTPKEGPSAGLASDEEKTVELGFGSKVLILCINGADSEAVIIGGIRDERSSDANRKSRGIHMDWEFNGVHVAINDDGSFSLQYKGPTTPEGKLDTARGKDEQVGTTVEVAADGSFKVATKDNKQSVVIDHKNGKISITADQDLTFHGQTIHQGKDADQWMVLGDKLVDVMSEILDELATETHSHPMGPTGPPINAARYKAIKAKLRQTILSKFIKVKENP
jgi:hypothetical protein